MKNLPKCKQDSFAVYSTVEKPLVSIMIFAAITFLFSCQKEINGNPDVIATNETSSNGRAAGNDYYISPSGNDGNAGSETSPWRTLTKGWSVLVAGDILYVRGGTYITSGNISLNNKSGTSGNTINIWNYPGEFPVFDWNSVVPASAFQCISMDNNNWINIKGIRVTNNPMMSSGAYYNYGFNINDGNNNITLENCEADHIGGSGFRVHNSNNVLLLNCDAHHCDDPNGSRAHEDANGYEIAGPSSAGFTNILRGCRAWWCADDGFDTFNGTQNVIFDNCWGFWNGYIPGTFTSAGDGNGFKFGQYPSLSTQVLRTITNCLAFENGTSGFDQNFTDNSHGFPMVFYNNTAYKNLGLGFFLSLNYAYNVKNNVSHKNTTDVTGGVLIGGATIQSNNSWNGGVTLSDADFLSVSSAGVDGTRQSDGSLPVLNFLKLASGSDLINKGTNVGLPFTGSSPDLGAFESGMSTSTPSNQPPVANAGPDKNILLPVNTVSLTGSGSDPDGNISSYTWSLSSGPNSPALSGMTTNMLTASNLTTGTYIFRLTVTDNDGQSAFDDVNVTVTSASAPVPTPPSSPTGTNVIILSQVSQDVGNAYFTTQDFGTPADEATNPVISVLRIYENGVELQPPHSAHIDIRNVGNGRFSHWSNGSYTGLYFSSSDNTNPQTNGRVYTFSIGSITSNQAPFANAGLDKNITLPANTITLSGSGNDPDGNITAYLWTVISGPNSPELSGALSPSVTASNLVEGTYVFRFTVTDNGGLTGYDEVTVVAINIPSAPTTTNLINTSNVIKSRRFSYSTEQNFGTAADNLANPTGSVLRIFENGVELSPPHSSHNSIIYSGMGRFSHWDDGSTVTLYFSSSDNTNPTTNGRVYTYSIQ